MVPRRRILVLGGDGFLGSHLVDQVLAQGHEVTVFDRFEDGRARNLEHQRGRAVFRTGDFNNPAHLAAALAGQEVVYHFIGGVNPHATWANPLAEVDLSLKGSLVLAELAVAAGVRKIVFPSSGGTVYGPQSGPVTEAALPRPISPYGITKLAVELFLGYYRERTGLAADVFRIGNPFGPRQPTGSVQGVVALWMEAILADREIVVYGDAGNVRDYVYAEDAAHLLTHSLADLAASETYNLGTGRGTSILELLHIFQRAVDQPFRFRLEPRRPSDNVVSILDSARLLAHFPGFKFRPLEEMIAHTWQRLKAQAGGR